MSSLRYTKTAIAIHWISAAVIIAAFVLAFSLDEMPLSPKKLQMISWHKWLGITALGLTAFRLLWRITHIPPEPVTTIPRWQQLSAIWLHRTLYFMLLVIPLSGWAMSCAKGYPVVYLGLIPLPCLLEKNLELGAQLLDLHEALNYALLGMLFLHVAAAIKHHIIERDETLARMIPWLRKANN